MADIVTVETPIYSNPVVDFESYTYNNGQTGNIDKENLTLEYPLVTIKCSYAQDEGDELKCYQFFLYNSTRNLIGGSEKIFSRSAPIFTCENLNNNSVYYLDFKCISQSGNEVESRELTIITNYNQDKIYGNLTIALDSSNAENIVLAELIELTGTGYHIDDMGNITEDVELEFINNEEVKLNNGNYVVFEDDYELVKNNFICRLWLRDLTQNVALLTLTNNDNTIYITVIFKDNRFHAYKHSCGLISHYVSSVITNINSVYLALGYYNGRVDLYAKNISEEVSQ